MRRFLFRGVVFLASLVGGAQLMNPDQTVPLPNDQKDKRLRALRKFFGQRQSPVAGLSEDFLVAADAYGLDWRLLPGIAIIESGGGKAYTNNNIFGWNSCDTAFRTVREGIYRVGERLALSKLYKNKSTHSKLRTYNANDGYPDRVAAVMRQLSVAYAAAD